LLLFLAEEKELFSDSPKILGRRCEGILISRNKIISEGIRFNLRFRPSRAFELLPSKLSKLLGMLDQALITLPSDFVLNGLFDEPDTFKDVGDVINPPLLDLQGP
jgi:hypothetical protein